MGEKKEKTKKKEDKERKSIERQVMALVVAKLAKKIWDWQRSYVEKSLVEKSKLS